VKFRSLICLTLAGTALAQEEEQPQPNPPQPPPKAEPADPAIQPNPGEDWYQHGRNLYESAKKSAVNDQKLELYGRAIDVFTRYLGEYPNHPNAEAASWYLGESYYATGRVDDAKRSYHALLARGKKSRYASASANRLAVDHYQNRQYALAAPLFEKMADLADLPEQRYRGLYYAAVSYDVQGRTREATDLFRKLLADPTPGNPFLHQSQAGLGRLLARAQKLDEALPLLDQAVMSRSGPEIRGPAAVDAGMVAAKLGKKEVSEKYLMLVMTTPGMEKYRPDAQYTLMASAFDRKDYKEVIDIFRRSTEKAEGEQEARRLMLAAKSFMALDKNVEALDLFREIEKLMLPNNIYAFEANFQRLLCFYLIEGRHVPEQVDAFLDLYQKGRPRDPKIHTALLMKAETLMGDKKVVEAAKVYNEIDGTLLSPENRRGFVYKRACCLLAAEDPQGAIRSFSDFLKDYPDDPRVPDALIQRAQAYDKAGDPAKALADYDKIIARDASEEFKAVAYLQSADIARQQANLADMIGRYKAFLEKMPKASNARLAKANYWVGWGLVKSDAMKDALPYADKARKLDEKFYGKNAGVLIAMANWSLQNPDGPRCRPTAPVAMRRRRAFTD
jgi:TolA-binding protein